jgi:hypothetical protein
MVHLFKKKEKEKKKLWSIKCPSLSNNNSPSPHPMLLPLLAASHYPLSLFHST